MKKNLLVLGAFAVSLSANAQLMNVNGDATVVGPGNNPPALFYISEGTLVYSGGGVQTKGNGQIDVHGNMMIVGTGSDVVKTTAVDGTTDKVDGGNIILRLNDVANFANSTYGQLYISGIDQGSLRAIVNKEYKDLNQGSFQQMALPFSGKTFASIATDLGRTSNFSSGRNTNAVGYNDNTNTVVRVVPPTTTTTDESAITLYGPTTYFSVGTSGWNPSPATGTVNLKGRPYSDQTNMVVQLTNGGKPGGTPINYGGGEAINMFNEKYKTYLNDPFDTRWTATYGKELYQYSNPFFTNIDLSLIGITESATTGDGNKLPIKGIRYSQSQIVYSANTGTTTTVNNIVTFNYSGANGFTITPVGDIDKLVVKPMGAIYIKLDPTLETTYSAAGFTRALDFKTLRRFKSTARASNTNYSITAAKNTTTTSTVKQLGVIALDSSGMEVGRTYYAVSPDFTTGYTTGYNVQANAGYGSTNVPNSSSIYTNEEFPTGGGDPSYTNQYNLYINEANENNFKNKEIPLAVRGSVSKLKFEIREDANLIPTATNLLSSGEGFWIKVNGTNTLIAQDSELNINSGDFGLYYGEPSTTSVLAVNDINKNETVVAFEKSSNEFYAIFDKNWKKADIEIYDLSGKLISTQKGVYTNSKYLLKIPKDVKIAYLVVLKSDSGQVYNTKIMR